MVVHLNHRLAKYVTQDHRSNLQSGGGEKFTKGYIFDYALHAHDQVGRIFSDYRVHGVKVVGATLSEGFLI